MQIVQDEGGMRRDWTSFSTGSLSSLGDCGISVKLDAMVIDLEHRCRPIDVCLCWISGGDQGDISVFIIDTTCCLVAFCIRRDAATFVYCIAKFRPSFKYRDLVSRSHLFLFV